MEIKTLDTVSPEEQLKTFNLAFSDYSVPIKLSPEQFRQKVLTESIDPEISVGVFNESELVGFILHGKRVVGGKKTFYNAGTGVIPSERGAALTTRMYDYILPLLKSQGYEQGLLEVISTNDAAIHIYKKTGFRISRSLECYKGTPSLSPINSDVKIDEMERIDWESLRPFWDWMPTWQYLPETIDFQSDSLKKITATKDGKIIGYALLDPNNNKVKHFAIDRAHRNQKIASGMLSYLSQGKPISVINVDGNDTATNAFMLKLGLEKFLTQYEMTVPQT